MKLEKDFKFKDIQYTRPDCEAFQKLAEDNAEKIKNAVSYSEAKKVFLEFDKAESEFFDMGNIAYIRHTIDTSDEFYDKENEFLNEKTPELMPSLLAFSNAVYDSRFKPDFVAEFGDQMFAEIELRRKSFSEKNIPLLQKEARLCNEYEKIIASADILFDGKHLNLYGIMSYFENPDRNVRHDAYKAYSKFYESNEENFERIWDELIKVRTEMGKNLGFENYIPLGYMKSGMILAGLSKPDHIKLWLDDVREAPEGYCHCHSVNEAKKKIIG